MPLHRIHAGRHLHTRNSAVGKCVHPAVESQSRNRGLGKSLCLWLAAQVKSLEEKDVPGSGFSGTERKTDLGGQHELLLPCLWAKSLRKSALPVLEDGLWLGETWDWQRCQLVFQALRAAQSSRQINNYNPVSGCHRFEAWK